MLITESYRRCVGFITSDEPIGGGRKHRIPIGTVFFVSVPHDLSKTESAGFTVYAVTAKHNIIDHPSDEITVRTNKRASGTYSDIPTHRTDWIPHPGTDVAVCIPKDADIECFQYDFLSPYSTQAHTGYEVGDLLFSVGLFEGFAGNSSVMPIARFGKISLMPHEHERLNVEIGLDNYVPISGYLAELTCWHGQSGSPVFVALNEGRERHHLLLQSSPAVPFCPALIGLVQGFYPIEGEKINAGIAIVVPA